MKTLSTILVPLVLAMALQTMTPTVAAGSSGPEGSPEAGRDQKSEINRVDLSVIPLEDALLLGAAEARTRVVVFSDPECQYCKHFHEEMEEVVMLDPDIAFLIKLYPLSQHPNAYRISQSIVCAKSMAFLEASYAGNPVPPPSCKTQVVDQTRALVKQLGIRSTPTLVLPDGRIMPGFKDSFEVLQMLGSKVVAAPGEK